MNPLDAYHSLKLRLELCLRRRLCKRRAILIQDAITSNIDLADFDRRCSGADSKYCRLVPWLRESILRFLSYRLDELEPPKRFLDLGCGPGYFQLVCRHFGHDAVGLDLDNDAFFNDVISYLRLKRIVHCIRPFERLPRAEGEPFDVVTAFMTCFNRYPDGMPWEEKEWSFFLDDVVQQVRPGGRLIVKFNRNHKIGRAFPKTLPNMLRFVQERQVVFFADTMLVRL